MFADLGFYLLFLCTILSCYGTLASFFSARTRQVRLYRSARLAATMASIFCIVAAALQFYMFMRRDYSVLYIYNNSSNDLPWNYTIAAFWSALEGSHFFWTLLLSIFSIIAHWTASKNNEHIMPWVSMTLQAILGWMYYLAISYSDPFLRNLPVPPDGLGMNALLQNPYMAFHPPTLFIGYTTLAIPFAYSIAALCFGDITEGWLKTVRRWTLVGWTALTVGIVLGGCCMGLRIAHVWRILGLGSRRKFILHAMVVRYCSSSLSPCPGKNWSAQAIVSNPGVFSFFL